jgi:ubiquitin
MIQHQNSAIQPKNQLCKQKLTCSKMDFLRFIYMKRLLGSLRHFAKIKKKTDGISVVRQIKHKKNFENPLKIGGKNKFFYIFAAILNGTAIFDFQ